MQTNLSLKSEEDIGKMSEGGKKLCRIKEALKKEIEEGVSAWEIEVLAESLIAKAYGMPSFKMVPGYSWATCINVNEGLVHGIPKKEVVFKERDVVSVDLGMFYKGFHTDCAFTVVVGEGEETKKFLETGEKALDLAIKKAIKGNRVFDISKAVQNTVEEAGYSAIRALVGHGVGKMLHEEPQIPCFVSKPRKDSPEIVEGMVLAIEVMYCQGSPEVITASDGWTISMADAKMSGLFEETVAVTGRGPLVLTTLM